VLGFAVTFASLSIPYTNAVPKIFCWAKPVWIDFSSSNFLLQGNIVNTSTAAPLRSPNLISVYLKPILCPKCSVRAISALHVEMPLQC
jgi:hypothetical protein